MLRRTIVGPLHTNCWIVHGVDAREALVVDPGDEPHRILASLGDLQVTAIALTHAHWDHVLGITALTEMYGVPVFGHQIEQSVWQHELDFLQRNGYFDAGTDTARLLAAGAPPKPMPDSELWNGKLDRQLVNGDAITVGPLSIETWHTPGHTPGGICLAMPGHLLTGDTLFPGGPGLTGAQWPLSDFHSIMDSVRRVLNNVSPRTMIHPGHGPDTTAGREKPHLAQWQARGW